MSLTSLFFRKSHCHTFEKATKSLFYVYNFFFVACLLFLLLISNCTQIPRHLHISEMHQSFPEGSIISSKNKAELSFEALVDDLKTARIVYVGEQHNNPSHHDIQLKILKAMYVRHPGLIVGMEMFDQRYQTILDQWSAGMLDRQTFIEKVHWYANWQFDFELYEALLDFIKTNRIPLVGLNIPARVTARIAVGGMDSLLPSDKVFLPRRVDVSNKDHRKYIEMIFAHHNVKGRDNFEYFYTAQCVWDEAMAESIAEHIGNSFMFVIAGNGHLVNKFGIPDRAFDRLRLPFRTILPYPAGREIELNAADYLWVSPP